MSSIIKGVSRRTLLRTAGAAALAAPLGGLGLRTPARAADKIVVGMAWPGMQDAVWSTSHALLEELAAKSDPPIELVFTANPVALRQWIITDDLGQATTVILGEFKTGGEFKASLFNITDEVTRRKK